MSIETYIRKLARTTYYQLLYQNAKELRLSLFENKLNLSGIQIIFTYWLRTYGQLYENITLDEYLNIKVINNDIRLDAYLVLKKEERKKEKLEMARQKIKDKLNKSMDNVSETTFYQKKV